MKLNDVKRLRSWKHKFPFWTRERLQALWDSQEGKCAICGRVLHLKGVLTNRTKDVAQLDHDHDTNKVRAFLCGNYNIGLGHLQDNPDILEKAALYLRFHQKKV